jgi:hypothetical protein
MADHALAVLLLVAFVVWSVQLGRAGHSRTLHDPNPDRMSEGWLGGRQYGRRQS